MPLTHNYLIDHLLVPVVFLFFLVSGLFGIGFGIGLAVFRERVFEVFRPMNRWVSGRKNLEPLEAAHPIEPFVYRNRRWFSAVFIVGGLFSLLMLLTRVDAAAIASIFGDAQQLRIASWLIQSIGVLLIFGSAVAIVIGVMLAFFPRKLQAFESRSNRWFSSRQIAKGADEVHLPLDRWFQKSPRTAGCILAVAALILTINSIVVLLGRG